MIRSMTAYGRASVASGGKKYLVEIKSVNNRYFDCSVKLPRLYGYLEEKIKSYLQTRGISRGKVDVFVTIDILESEGAEILLDDAYAKSYITALKNLRDKFGLTDDISVMTVAQNRDLFLTQKPPEDAEKVWDAFRPVLDEAMNAFLAMREKEGAHIAADLLEKENKIQAITAKIKEISERNTRAYAEKLESRLRVTLNDLDIEMDSGRILTECAIFADRIAIDEELVRLGSHFKAFEAAMRAEEPVGRKIDFLLQEMNREVNTAGSKSQDAEIAGLIVEAKCELEKIREQIQNIE